MNSFLTNFNYAMHTTKFIGILPMVIQLIITVIGINWLKENHKKLAGGLFTLSIILLAGNIFLTFSGLLNEQVIDEFGDKVYFGQIENRRANGWGRLFDADRNILYIGQFKNNQYYGEGEEYIFSRGECLLVYSGQHLAGTRNGQGIYHAYDDNNIETQTYEGSWAYNHYFGYGIQTIYETETGESIENERYEGTFVYDQKDGWGKRYINNKLKYYGDWKDGEYEGDGTLFYTHDGDKRKYVGTFVNGKADGEGTAYDENGNELRSGKVKEGTFVDE